MRNKKTVEVVKRLLPISITNLLKKGISHPKTIIYNLGFDATKQPKVFVSYIHDFMLESDSGKWHGTRDLECSIFVKILICLGCRVDVCNVNCIKGIRNDYDYVIGQGEAFRSARELNPKAKAILYLTEKPPKYSLRKEKERISYLYERHKLKATLNRTGRFFKECDFLNLSCCIMIGCEKDSLLLPNIRTYLLKPTGLKNKKFAIKDRNINLAKKHFLWIGSFGAVHKGLDILFDVFRETPDLTLHMAGLNRTEKKFLSCLIPCNVIDYSYMDIQSEEFRQVVNQCAFVVFSSCSEGMATSVITAMNHGLIPLITEESSIELNGIGEIFKDYKVETIAESVKRWSNKDNQYLEMQINKTIEFSISMFDKKVYTQTLQNILSDIFM